MNVMFNRCILLWAVALASPTLAQSLQDRPDGPQQPWLLNERRLPEAHGHSMVTHSQTDPIDAAQNQIAAQRTLLSDPAIGPDQRLASVQRLLKVRAQLIGAQADDPRRGVWLADQAEDLFFVLLPIEGSGLTNLFGLPSPAQRARAQRVAGQINDLAAEAEIEIERAILEIESTPGYVDDIALQMKRRRLADNQRHRRIPFLRGIGAFLHAQLNVQSSADRRRLYELAARMLEPLGGKLPGMLAGRARVYAGLALAGLRDFEAAERLFGLVTSDPASDPVDVFAALMGAVMSQAAQHGSQAGLEALDSIEPRYTNADALFFRVLIADQRFLLRRQLASQTTGRQREELLRRAFDAYLDLLDAELGVPAATVRQIVFARLTTAANADAPLEQLPAIVAVAQAEKLAGADDTRAQAITLFGRLLSRPDLDQRARALALFSMAKALLANGQRLEAAQRFAQVAREHPAQRGADRAIELAATIAAELYRKTPRDPTVRSFLSTTLDELLNRFPNLPTIDRWRSTAGRLALAEQEYAQALAIFEQIPPDAEQWLDAQFMQAAVLQAWTETPSDAAERQRLAPQLLKAVQHARDVIDRAVKRAEVATGDSPWRAGEQTDSHLQYLASLRVFQATALLEVGEPQQAVESLQGADTDPSLDSATIAKALLIRIDAYYALGRGNEVEHQIERLLEVAPDRAGGILATMLKSRQRGVTALIEMSRDDEATQLARRELAPLADAVGRWLALDTADAPDADGLRLRAADAYRLAERYDDALRLYDTLLLKHPNAVEALLGRAECLFGLGGDQYPQAMAIYKRISSAAAEGGDYYWQSQLRMLQILDRTNRNTRRIAPHIRRLRQRDPQLGGERFRRGFEILQNEHS
ncbi:MAG: tetratricopeptide repeat protein [Planctomycetes bacterium]|nr:tetratricopeptide repeat protein [Planctomycetota bacterium]